MSNQLSVSNIQPQIFNQSVFGELMTAELHGTIQLQFVYNIPPELVTLSASGSGTVTSQPPFALLSVAGSNSFATLQSIKSFHYQPGQGGSIVFASIFTIGIPNINQYVGLGNLTDGFFFGWNGSTFGILYRNNTVDTWIFQISWNADSFDGNGLSNVTLNPTQGNIYKIQYQGLGFGIINFFIQNDTSGAWTLVHQISCSNNSPNAFVTSPTLPLFARVEADSSDSLAQVWIPAMAAFIEGKAYVDNTRYSIIGLMGLAGSPDPVLLLTIKNNTTFNGHVNPKSVRPDFTSFGTAGTSGAVFTYMLNPVVSASYIPVNSSTGTSITSYAVGGSVSQVGRTILTEFLNANSYDNVFLNFLNLNLNPGDILAVAVTSANSATVGVSFSWTEQF